MKIIPLMHVIAGNLIINFPIAVFGYYQLFSLNSNLTLANAFFVVTFQFVYWSLVVPFYKLYSVRNLFTKDDFLKWEKWSVRSFLFWPQSFNLDKLECWDADNLKEFLDLRSKFLQ